jgi:hypothetical protein
MRGRHKFNKNRRVLRRAKQRGKSVWVDQSEAAGAACGGARDNPDYF